MRPHHRLACLSAVSFTGCLLRRVCDQAGAVASGGSVPGSCRRTGRGFLAAHTSPQARGRRTHHSLPAPAPRNESHGHTVHTRVRARHAREVGRVRVEEGPGEAAVSPASSTTCCCCCCLRGWRAAATASAAHGCARRVTRVCRRHRAGECVCARGACVRCVCRVLWRVGCVADEVMVLLLSLLAAPRATRPGVVGLRVRRQCERPSGCV
jgi:hypothetical protein